MVLIADDNPNNLQVLSEALESFGLEVRVALDGNAAVESALREPPDIILLDVHMPELDGYEACEILKKDNRTKAIPIIFISALSESFNKIRGFQLGAVDYLTKPIELEETKARITVQLALRAHQKELEEFNQIMLDREMRMIELKKEVNALTQELGRKTPYPEVWEEKS